jgi:hypothetical protein
MSGPDERSLIWAPADRARQSEPAHVLPATRWLSLARAAYGAGLLALPGPMITAITGSPASGRTCAIARVLGARHLAQALLCGLVPARRLIQAGAAADGAHCASMVALAVASAPLRRAAATDAAIAAALAGASTVALRR